jgi:hypothetical protein
LFGVVQGEGSRSGEGEKKKRDKKPKGKEGEKCGDRFRCYVWLFVVCVKRKKKKVGAEWNRSE